MFFLKLRAWWGCLKSVPLLDEPSKVIKKVISKAIREVITKMHRFSLKDERQKYIQKHHLEHHSLPLIPLLHSLCLSTPSLLPHPLPSPSLSLPVSSSLCLLPHPLSLQSPLSSSTSLVYLSLHLPHLSLAAPVSSLPLSHTPSHPPLFLITPSLLNLLSLQSSFLFFHIPCLPLSLNH